MACDTNHSFRNYLKCTPLSSQNDSIFANLGNEEDIEHSLSSILNNNFVTVIPINPQLAFINWQIDNRSILSLKNDLGSLYEDSSLILRIYDVTGIDFNGFNARTQLDLDIDAFSGCHYLQIDQVGILLMVEVGLRCTDLRFFPCARSNNMFFEGPRDFSSGLYISHGFNRFYMISRTFEPPSEPQPLSISSPLLSENSCSVAVFLNEFAISNDSASEKNLPLQIRSILALFQQSNINAHLFTPLQKQNDLNPTHSSVDYAFQSSMQSLENFYEVHRKKPFHCVQSHNWYSAPAAMIAASENYLPFVSVCHSLQLEKKCNMPVAHSQLIESWERKSIFQADMVLVSKESTRKLVIEHYGKAENRVIIVADPNDNSCSKKQVLPDDTLPFNLSLNDPILLFAGELTQYCGADLIIEALPNVCREFPSVQFVFTGDGEIKTTLENRASTLQIRKNCCFTGHLDTNIFDILFNAAFALLLPSRQNYSCGLAQRAILEGLTILTTHQANISGIEHGSNGLLVYDNPGSVCWGIKEILSKPHKDRKNASDFNLFDSIESIAKVYSSIWMNLVSSGKEVCNINGCI